VAISIARERQRPVFLLDVDMRNPSVCRFLGIQDIRPLPDYFRGDAKAEDVLAQTSVPNLIVAGALTATGSPSSCWPGRNSATCWRKSATLAECSRPGGHAARQSSRTRPC
jgi:Mrp family chromosome partitioning ATPase